MASGYRIYEIEELLIKLRDRLDPGVAERTRNEARYISNAEADVVIAVLRAELAEGKHG